MNILITGANGFLGKNLIERLNSINGICVYKFDKEDSLIELDQFTKTCDFVFHFAAVHRPLQPIEFVTTNCDLTQQLVNFLKNNKNSCPILLTSSIQALDNSDYGRSKLIAESIVKNHSLKNNSKVYLYRLTNTFGKWALPNQHSVVATFCFNISNNIPVTISDPNHIMNFYYIDDVIDSFIARIYDRCEENTGYYKLKENLIYSVSLKELSDLINYYNEIVKNKEPVELRNEFQNKLYKTFLSYISKPSIN